MEVWRAFQLALERIRPAMIRTAQLLRMTLRLIHDCCRMMAAHVEESTQSIVVTANDDDWLVAEVCRYVVTRLGQLIDARRYLPGMTKNSLLFEPEDALVGVPGRGNCRSLIEPSDGIVGRD